MTPRVAGINGKVVPSKREAFVSLVRISMTEAKELHGYEYA
jgi:hypothetical protein